MKMTYNSVFKAINRKGRSGCFQFFIFDFIIDADGKAWLLSVDSNPSIDTQDELSQSLIPRMLDDGFKLTLDKLFPVPNGHKMQRESLYPVTGYSNEENLWEKL